jgi:Protein of unknown function (DUF3604)
MNRPGLIAVGVLLASGLWFFSGSAPDAAYRLLPGYIADPQQWWSQTPLDASRETPRRLPEAVIAARAGEHSGTGQNLHTDKQILFGDTHVHTTNSADAFMYSLPLMHGAVGAFPPAYACDYARFISQLDFYFLTDHAESFTPSQWQDAIRSVRQCNQLAGQASNPDLVAFIGWEWTQVGATAEQHFGHHNILFKDDDPSLLPARPIAARGAGVATVAARSENSKLPWALRLLDPRHRRYYASYNRWVEMMAATPPCDASLSSPELPPDCYESAATPGELYRKLDQWGFDNIIIPHGMSWGFYTPPDADWHHQLGGEAADPGRTGLIEVYSGHGSSEVFRDFAVRQRDAQGNWYCPQPRDNYLPACWQAGNIILSRCLGEGIAMSECEARAETARSNFVQIDTIHGFMTVPDSQPAEWLDAGQARDVFLPAFNYRPRKSAQYGLALQGFDDPQDTKRFRWGFVASTDTHSARAGHGFKQIHRKRTTDANGIAGPFWEGISRGAADIPPAGARSLNAEQIDPVNAGLYATEFERTASFMTAGGLAAVHSQGRNREAIWDAMKRREVYGTSGHRMLLWFDLLDKDSTQSVSPMGSEVTTRDNPHFRVKAVGSFKQLPGCPAYVVDALAKRQLDKMAGGECYHPSGERYNIERIEVIKIRPQIHADEAVAPLIEDPWRVFHCQPSQDGCSVEFSDEAFAANQRDALYYVRALEEPIAVINAGNLRTRFDEGGKALATSACNGDYHTPVADDCLQQDSQRAWSSPIFVNFKAAQ